MLALFVNALLGIVIGIFVAGVAAAYGLEIGLGAAAGMLAFIVQDCGRG